MVETNSEFSNKKKRVNKYDLKKEDKKNGRIRNNDGYSEERIQLAVILL